MPTLLHLDSSAADSSSRSRGLTRAFADTWRGLGSDHTVVYRDLHADPLPHLPDAALHWPARLRPADANPPAEAVKLQDELVAELLSADVLLVGAPMYNYSLPSALKAWIDYVHIPGLLAPFDEPTQPLAGRPAVVVTSQGATYDAGSPTEGWDHGVPVLQLILGKNLGMAVEVITASRTLAERVPAMAAELDRSRAEFIAAKAAAEDAATRLGKTA